MENICLFSSQRRDPRLKIIQKGTEGGKKNCTQNSKWLFRYRKGRPSSLGRAGGARPSREAELQQGLSGQERTRTPAAPLAASVMRADEVSTATQAARGLRVDAQWVHNFFFKVLTKKHTAKHVSSLPKARNQHFYFKWTILGGW